MAIASDAASWPTEGLDEAELAADPERQFNQWMADAVTFGLPEPTAVVLATVSAAGQPRARTVLLKDHDASSFTFYTNRTSRKGADLDEVPRACLLFPWHAMHRQVIVEGPVTALPAAASEAYFHSRPRASQLAAWASRQSTVLDSRRELEDRYASLERRWRSGEEVPYLCYHVDLIETLGSRAALAIRWIAIGQWGTVRTTIGRTNASIRQTYSWHAIAKCC